MSTSKSESESTATSGKVILGTPYVLADEKAFGLVEVMLPAPNYKGRNRYQIIYVARNGRLAEFRKDLGKAKKFKALQFRIPSLWEHTVAELMDIAETLRNSPGRIDQFIPKPEDSQLLEKFADRMERQMYERKGKKVYA